MLIQTIHYSKEDWLELLDLLKKSQVTKVRVLDLFVDDHQPCLALEVELEHHLLEKIDLEDWWIGENLRVWYAAETGNEDCLQKATEYVHQRALEALEFEADMSREPK